MSLVSIDTPARDTLGRRLHDLRISVTDNCNLRCTYCMPADEFAGHRFLTPPEKLSFDEIERLAGLFAFLGVEKLRITGGEPLLRRDLPTLIERLAAIHGIDDLALTTNGVLLEKQAATLKRAGLKRVTVSLDTLDEEIFRRMTGRDRRVEEVLRGIDRAAAVGLGPVKINVVVQRGVNEDTLVELLERFRGTGHIVRFIEYMDVGTCNGWRMEHVVPSREILERVRRWADVTPLDKNYHGEVAERYAYADGSGEIGFISSVTAPFCGGCTRARLSADGHLYTCLFASSGLDLRAPMRAGAPDAQLLELIRGAWEKRNDRYSEERSSNGGLARSRRRPEMYEMGG